MWEDSSSWEKASLDLERPGRGREWVPRMTPKALGLVPAGESLARATKGNTQPSC